MDKLKKILILSLTIHIFYVLYLILFGLKSIMISIIFSIVAGLLYFYLSKNIKEPLNPNFIFPFWFYFSFIVPLPYLISSVESTDSWVSDPLYHNENILFESLLLVLVAIVAFSLSVKPKLKTNLFYLVRNINVETISGKYYLLAFILFAVSFYIRHEYQLGVAGEKPNIKFAGILQYVFFNGNIALLAYLFTSSFKNNNKYILYSFLLTFTLIISQGLLGWRGDSAKFGIFIISLFILVFVSRKYKLNVNIKFPLKFILLFVILSPLFMQFGDSIRNENNDDITTSSFSGSKFIESFVLRGQGLTRLMVVVNNIDKKNTLTNDFLFLEFDGISSTNYIDNRFYDIEVGRSHSVGGGGVGNAYLSAGILGVFIVYWLLGVFYRYIYSLFLYSNNDSLFIAIYAQMMILLPNYIEENTGFGIINDVVVVLFFAIVYGLLFTNKLSADKTFI